MDEKLTAVIDKVMQLARQNAEFDAMLRKKLGTTASAQFVSDNRIKNIERYLGLDYYLDNIESIIDYSFVTLPDVRAQLISDNREMLRFRYGTRYHKIDFFEFCRYAHLQAEMLLNYYYDVKFRSDLEAIKAYVSEHNSYPVAANVKSLGAISYNNKLWAFNDLFKDRIDASLLNTICKVRNESSHRSMEQAALTTEKYRKRLESRGFSFRDSGWLNTQWPENEQGYRLQRIFESEIKTGDDYRRYCYLLWLNRQPYEEIVEGIKQLAAAVASALG